MNGIQRRHGGHQISPSRFRGVSTGRITLLQKNPVLGWLWGCLRFLLAGVRRVTMSGKDPLQCVGPLSLSRGVEEHRGR